jgi:uncharacterized membrane protein
MKKIFRHPLVWLIIVLLLPLVSLFSQGMPFVHDGQDHVARIANFYQSLSEGNIIPRWAANLNWGYGHPILMFLYPFPSYMASLFHFLGYSFVDSTKLVFGISFVLSGLSMYLWLSSAWNKRVGFIGALLYVFAPYRFVDLYVRGALGEHVAFIFPPLVLYFLYKLATSDKHIRFGSLLSLSFAGLILAHNAIALMFVPIIALYGLYLLFFETKKRILFIIYSTLFIGLGFGGAAFFWVPAYFEGKYTLRDIVATNEVTTTLVPLIKFFYSPWDYGGSQTLSKSLGYLQWIGVLASIIAVWKIKVPKYRVFNLGILVILCISIFIMTKPSAPIWLTIRTLQKFQFAWRFLSVSVFAIAVAGAVAIDSILFGVLKIKSTLRIIFVVAFCILLTMSTVTMWYPKGYQIKSNDFYAGVYPGTTDTGESTPIWTVRFMEHTAKASMEVISGNSSIAILKRTTTDHEYTITSTSPSRILENTLYFPGWKVYVDGVATDVQFQDPYFRGLMTFHVAEGNHRVKVVFEDTKLRAVANIISFISFCIIGISLLISLIWRKRI